MILELASLAAMCAPNVDITTLSSVVRHESQANIYAIGVNGDYTLPRQPQDLDEAVATAEWLLENGYNFDSGLGQINSDNMDWLDLSIPDLFDPCKNLAAAERVLSECYTRAVARYGEGQPALQAALSCYNSGNFSTGFANGYVENVAANVGMPVPALEPIEGTPETPVQLKAEAQPAAGQTVMEDEEPSEGIGDAFSSGGSDAFGVAEELLAKETRMGDGG